MVLDSTALPDEFELHVTTQPGVAIVSIGGEVDMATSPVLRDALEGLSDDARIVVLECSRVSFIDSSTLRVLVAEQRRLHVAGRSLVLAALSDRVRDVLRTARLDAVFAVAETVDAAIGGSGAAGSLGTAGR